MKKLRLFVILCLAFASGLMTGCAKHYTLSTEYVANDAAETPAEVVSTSNYRNSLTSIKTIAVQAPDFCINETSTQKEGTRAESAILRINCGIEMGEIERGWAKFGYEVLSWKVLKQTQDKFNLSPRQAAERLGADAIVLINSTERSFVQPGENARWERRYFIADKQGHQQSPAYVNNITERQFIRMLGEEERKLVGKNRLSATINATVFLVSTGQAVWFYEWTHAEKKLEQSRADLHVICEKDFCRPAPQLLRGDRQTRLSSGNTAALSTQRTPQNQYRAIHSRLMKEVINDMVKKFSSGTV